LNFKTVVGDFWGDPHLKRGWNSNSLKISFMSKSW
jgi:hypothetical protein